MTSSTKAKKTKIRVVQWTDSHLFDRSQVKFLGLDIRAVFDSSMAYLFSWIKATEKPAWLFGTGDLSQDGSAASYRYIANCLNTSGLNWVCLPGNHDNFLVMKEILEHEKRGCCPCEIVCYPWHFILLNSCRISQVSGHLKKSELSFLHTALESKKAPFVFILLHHHVLPVGSVWVDRFWLRNQDVFLHLIDHHPCVRGVLSGHVHQEQELLRKQVRFFASPSLSFQFKQNSQTFQLDDLPPGFRWFDFCEDGNIETGIIRLPANPLFVPDFTSVGY